MHRVRDNNPKKHFARALAELPCGAIGSIVAQGLPDLRPLTELPPAQNQTMTEADFLGSALVLEIDSRNRKWAVNTADKHSRFEFLSGARTETQSPGECTKSRRSSAAIPSVRFRRVIPTKGTHQTGQAKPWFPRWPNI
jgi:hypothetical protein